MPIRISSECLARFVLGKIVQGDVDEYSLDSRRVEWIKQEVAYWSTLWRVKNARLFDTMGIMR